MNEEIITELSLIKRTRVPNDVGKVLIDGEEAIQAYRTVRDVAVFTNMRIIMSDVQGVSGISHETYSIPYKSIILWSSGNVGVLDLNAELTLWTRIGRIKINLGVPIDVRVIETLLAEMCL